MRLALLGCICFALPAFAAHAQDCAHDPAALLALPLEEFDQNLEGGWRALAELEGCEPAAAGLIAAYRDAHADTLGEEALLLRWHEGQLRATAGQTAAAIALFRDSYEAGEEATDISWNYYVDATIALLELDRAALQAARTGLAAVPPPPGFAEGVARAREQYGDEIADGITWPMNMDVVDGFIACFGKPYSEAYSTDCQP